MERTIWILTLTLAVSTGLGCKDSNQNYIGFDAQVTDTKGDSPAADSAQNAPSDASADVASIADAGRDSVADLAAAETATTDGDATEAGSSDGAALDTEQGQ